MIFISLIITAIVYSIFPIWYRWDHGATTKKKAWKMAIINFVVCHVIFMIVILAINPNASSMTAAPILWLFVGKCILGNKPEETCDANPEKSCDATPEENKTDPK